MLSDLYTLRATQLDQSLICCVGPAVCAVNAIKLLSPGVAFLWICIVWLSLSCAFLPRIVHLCCFVFPKEHHQFVGHLNASSINLPFAYFILFSMLYLFYIISG